VTGVPLLKSPCGGFRIETATWIQKWFKISDGTSTKKALCIIVFKAEVTGVAIETCISIKCPRGELE
jgi:hypothetical protein